MISFQFLSPSTLQRSPVFDTVDFQGIVRVFREITRKIADYEGEEVYKDLVDLYSEDSLVLILVEPSLEGDDDLQWSLRLPVTVAQLRSMLNQNNIEVSENE